MALPAPARSGGRAVARWVSVVLLGLGLALPLSGQEAELPVETPAATQVLPDAQGSLQAGPAQDAERAPASEGGEDAGAAQEGEPPDPPGGGAAAGGDDTPPDPEDWSPPDPEGPARLWLDKPPIDPLDVRRRPAEWADVLAAHGVAIDLEQRTVYVRGATIQDPLLVGDPIEYLVVTEQGKTHEALFLVRAHPSLIDACLRAAGLQPGDHTRFVVKDPPPPEEDVERGLVSPWLVSAAHGPLLAIDVTWVDAGGRSRSAALESLLLDLRTAEPLPELGWIYTGSRYGTYRQGKVEKRWFKGDVEGDIVAIYIAGRDSCLFERNSLEGIEDSWYFPNPELLPPRNTSVTLVFRPTGEAVPETPLREGATYDATGLDDEPTDASPADDEGTAGSDPEDG